MGPGRNYVVNRDPGGAENFGATPVAALEHFQDGAGRLGGVMALG